MFIAGMLVLAVMLGRPYAAASQARSVMAGQWGEYGSGPGAFKFPAMIAVDRQSNVYVADQHNHRVQKFDSAGTFILMWGRYGDGPGEFKYPYGIAVDSKGDVFVSDMNNNRLQKFTSSGVFLGSAGSYGSANGQFRYPYGIAVDKNDVLYVIDAFNYRIQKFTSDLQYISQWGAAERFGIKLYMPHEIAVAGNGNLLVSDRQNHRIAIFTPEGQLVKRFGEYGEGQQAAGGRFSEPHGVAVDESGEIYVCDRYNFSVQLFGASNQFKLQWLTTGVFDSSRHFPLGIAVKNGSVFITDHFDHCIKKYKILSK